jgi:hypothetical protein
MANRYGVRYTSELGTEGKGVIEIEAATFKTVGDFVDVYSGAIRNVGGTFNSSGDVVLRVRADVLLDVSLLPVG